MLGTEGFQKVYLETMMKRWFADVRALAEMAQTQPHAAYTVSLRACHQNGNFTFVP